MKNQNTLALFASLVLAGILLALGYLQTGQWSSLLAVPVLALGWVAFFKFHPTWLSSVLMISYLAAASYAILAGGSPYGLEAGSTCALVAWELSEQIFSPSTLLTQPMAARYHQQHVRLLLLSIGLGLALSEVLLFVRLSIPFAGLFFAALLVLFSLYRFFRSIRGH